MSQQLHIGDTVRLIAAHVHAPGALGVVMAEELWTDDNTPVAWDGIGERPGYTGSIPHTNEEGTTRLLVAMAPPTEPTPDSSVGWWVAARRQPHSYPWCARRDLEHVSRPEIKQLNRHDWAGHDGENSTVSDSLEGARRNMALLRQYAQQLEGGVA